MSSTKLVLSITFAAALAACGVARELPLDAGAPATACTTCHGDRSSSGDALARAAPATGAHRAHLAKDVACGSCHVVPESPDHMDGTVQVTFAGVALLHGATPSYAAGTCSNVYCHGTTLGAGGNVPAPSWSAGPLACDACHAAPPPSHAATSTACAGCHAGTVKPDGTIDAATRLHVNGEVEPGAGHAQGFGDPARHGPAAKQDLASCQGCHGVAFDGGTAGVSCATCHGGAAWISNCTFCHGTKLAVYTASDLGRAAPPRGSAGETATTDRAVGAHQRHLAGGTLGGAIACAECHDVPTDLSHLDGTAAVAFGPAAARGTNPVWNGATCAASYCHGATLAGGRNTAPSWTGGAAQVTCGSCHGVPPPAPHTTSSACDPCHSGYTATSVSASLHMNGTIDRTSTHAAGWSAKDQHGYSVNRGGLSSCKGCHGSALDGVGGTGPSCASCHSTAGFASWQSSCTFCHGNRTTGVAAPPVDTQGGTATTNVSVGVHASHLGTTLMAAPACTACHPDRTGSNVITDAAHVDGNGLAEVAFGALARTGGAAATYTRTSATSASCSSVYCHGRFTGGVSSGVGATMSWTSTAQVSCTSCHGAPPSTGQHSRHSGRSCGDCHPGYTTSAVNRTTHLDGAKQVGNRITTYSTTTRSCTTSCHGNQTW